jgi:hypothetical protein
VLTRLSRWLTRHATGRLVVLGVVVFLVFAGWALPAQSRAMQARSGNAGAPDLMLVYSPARLMAMAQEYGPAGRAGFIRARWTFDLAFPLVYGFFFVTTISWVFRRGYPSQSRWQRANLVPIGAVVFDFLENTATSMVMATYPDVPEAALWLAPACTFLKWILVAASVGLLLIGTGAAFRARRRV